MGLGINQYNPDYGVPPGWILDEFLEVRGFSQDEFARLCESSPEVIGKIVLGDAPVDKKMAVRFEKVLGIEAEIWLTIEDTYRRFCDREKVSKECVNG